ncbi:tetratricopeptide repeat protein [Martelella mediterranea]|nr:tetratricopeptide repeat protein [Martelella mediterranea]
MFSLFRTIWLCSFATVSLAASGAVAQSQMPMMVPGNMMVQGGDISKGSRLIPPENDDAGGEAGNDGFGLHLYDRMDADLPELPPEKPYNGPIDLAYGLYQRGYFESAYQAALVRAHKGDPAAETLIAEMIEREFISQKRAGKPMEWYRMAADSGRAWAVNRYGMALLSSDDEEDVAEGRKLIKQAAEAGNATAQYNYGNLLIQENPGQEGLRRALPWFEKAAVAAVPDAEYALSQIYPALDGATEQDQREALFWLERAAEDEHVTAQLELALKLINGDGVPTDLGAGFDWMHRAALKGNPAAASKLAYLYKNGIGTPVDEIAAATFYLKARQAGLDTPEMETFLQTLSPDELAKARMRAQAIVVQF